MRTAVAAAMAFLGLTACNQEVVTQLSSCQRDLGRNDAYLEDAKRSQLQAEQKVSVLEAQLKQAQEELAAGQTGGGRTAVPEATAEIEPATPPPAAADVAPPSGIKVGLSLPNHREERWVKDKLSMLAEAKHRGIELLVQVSDNDAVKQAQQCDLLLEQGIKVLIISACDGSAAAAIVEKAAAKGVAVISYDRLITDSPRFYYYLSFDGVKVGELQGEYLTKKVPRGTYLVLAGSPTDNNAKLFHQGAMRFIDPLKSRGAIKVVLDQYVKDWSPDEAKKLCEQALTTYKSVDAVLAPNDGTAGGCLQALEAHGLAGKVPITGQDAELSAAIRVNQGLQSMTIFKDTRQLAKKAIEMANDIAHGRPIKTRGKSIANNRRRIPAVLLTPYVVTKDNLDEMLVKTGYINKEALYRK